MLREQAAGRSDLLLTNRRQLITGLISFVAAPAIVRYASIMPVKALPEELAIEPDITASEVEARLRKEWLRSMPRYIRFCGFCVETARFPNRESLVRALNS